MASFRWSLRVYTALQICDKIMWKQWKCTAYRICVFSVVFTWFCPCFQCKDSFVYPHVPYWDNDMIFRILDLLSNSYGAVANVEPIRIAITSKHFIDNCLHASCFILCGIHSADETQSGRNSCPEFAFLTFSLDSYHCRCPVKVFHFYVVSALQFIVFLKWIP